MWQRGEFSWHTKARELGVDMVPPSTSTPETFLKSVA